MWLTSSEIFLRSRYQPKENANTDSPSPPFYSYYACSHRHHPSRAARLRKRVSTGAPRISSNVIRPRRRAGRKHAHTAARFGLARIRHPAHLRQCGGARRLLYLADVQSLGGESENVDRRRAGVSPTTRTRSVVSLAAQPAATLENGCRHFPRRLSAGDDF